jgi:hypothetical protein
VDGVITPDESSDECESQASSDNDDAEGLAQRWDDADLEFELQLLKALSGLQTKPSSLLICSVSAVSGWTDTFRFFHWKNKYNASDSA